MTFTKEQLQQIIETDHVQCGDAAALARELLESRAGAEPAREFLPKNLDRALGVVGVALPVSREEFNLQSERWIQRLIDSVISYADEFKEQPEPVVSFYCDGIVAAAKWVDQQREAYDGEHGRTDPDTGCFEFGNDAQRDYSDTLAEIAEGIRALHPNAANSFGDGWIPVGEEKPDPLSERRVCAYTPSPHDDMQYRFVPASMFKTVCSSATHWYYMEPPAVSK